MRARRRLWSWLGKKQVIDHVICDFNPVCSRAQFHYVIYPSQSLISHPEATLNWGKSWVSSDRGEHLLLFQNVYFFFFFFLLLAQVVFFHT